MKTRERLVRVCVYANFVFLAFMSTWLGFIPAVLVVRDLVDPGLKEDRIPDTAFRLHQRLSPKLAEWARDRVASGRAANLYLFNISGTEWPLFGSVFYLWSTEALQKAWEEDCSRSKLAPNVYARDAIEASTALVLDPNHAMWVKEHWGNEYLTRENTFYRYLIIAAMTAHHNLTGSTEHLSSLREQVESLAKEIDTSATGLLQDYPGECYPSDVMTAIACIRRADRILGTDHSAFVARAYRAFQGRGVGPLGLPPYAADWVLGTPLAQERGCGNSFMCNLAPELWPDAAKEWYKRYEENFWQYRWLAWGFREFSKGQTEKDWYVDVDAGPSVAGHGFAACAFGISAARVNGRFDHAYPLTAEMLACSWPTLDGRLLAPRFLSNATDAPYLGESCILYNLTRRTHEGVPPKEAPSSLPPLVHVMVLAYVGAGLVTLFAAWQMVRTLGRARLPFPALQFAVWAVLAGTGIGMFLFGHAMNGLLMLLCAQFLPRTFAWISWLGSRLLAGPETATTQA